MRLIIPQNQCKGDIMMKYVVFFGEDDSVEDNWNDDGECPPDLNW